MSLPRVLAAELQKTATLPAALVAVAVAVVGSIGITLLNALNVRAAVQSGRSGLVTSTSPVEAAFSAAPLGTAGAVILGVVVISSEYTTNSSDAGGGRQISATLTAIPGRFVVLAAKAVSVALLVAVAAAIAITASLALAHTVVGDAAAAAPDGRGDTIARAFGLALYWALTGLLALAITVLTRSGVIPLIVLIANSSLVSVSLLLTNVTPLARYLPDFAGLSLFVRDRAVVGDPLDPLGLLNPFTGGLVMTAWVVGLLAISAGVFARRDA